jgi:hypothetical protein
MERPTEYTGDTDETNSLDIFYTRFYVKKYGTGKLFTDNSYFVNIIENTSDENDEYISGAFSRSKKNEMKLLMKDKKFPSNIDLSKLSFFHFSYHFRDIIKDIYKNFFAIYIHPIFSQEEIPFGILDPKIKRIFHGPPDINHPSIQKTLDLIERTSRENTNDETQQVRDTRKDEFIKSIEEMGGISNPPPPIASYGFFNLLHEKDPRGVFNFIDPLTHVFKTSKTVSETMMNEIIVPYTKTNILAITPSRDKEYYEYKKDIRMKVNENKKRSKQNLYPKYYFILLKPSARSPRLPTLTKNLGTEVKDWNIEEFFTIKDRDISSGLVFPREVNTFHSPNEIYSRGNFSSFIPRLIPNDVTTIPYIKKDKFRKDMLKETNWEELKRINSVMNIKYWVSYDSIIDSPEIVKTANPTAFVLKERGEWILDNKTDEPLGMFVKPDCADLVYPINFINSEKTATTSIYFLVIKRRYGKIILPEHIEKRILSPDDVFFVYKYKGFNSISKFFYKYFYYNNLKNIEEELVARVTSPERLMEQYTSIISPIRLKKRREIRKKEKEKEIERIPPPSLRPSTSIPGDTREIKKLSEKELKAFNRRKQIRIITATDDIFKKNPILKNLMNFPIGVNPENLEITLDIFLVGFKSTNDTSLLKEYIEQNINARQSERNYIDGITSPTYGGNFKNLLSYSVFLCKDIIINPKERLDETLFRPINYLDKSRGGIREVEEEEEGNDNDKHTLEEKIYWKYFGNTFNPIFKYLKMDTNLLSHKMKRVMVEDIPTGTISEEIGEETTTTTGTTRNYHKEIMEYMSIIILNTNPTKLDDFLRIINNENGYTDKAFGMFSFFSSIKTPQVLFSIGIANPNRFNSIHKDYRKNIKQLKTVDVIQAYNEDTIKDMMKKSIVTNDMEKRMNEIAQKKRENPYFRPYFMVLNSYDLSTFKSFSFVEQHGRVKKEIKLLTKEKRFFRKKFKAKMEENNSNKSKNIRSLLNLPDKFNSYFFRVGTEEGEGRRGEEQEDFLSRYHIHLPNLIHPIESIDIIDEQKKREGPRTLINVFLMPFIEVIDNSSPNAPNIFSSYFISKEKETWIWNEDDSERSFMFVNPASGKIVIPFLQTEYFLFYIVLVRRYDLLILPTHVDTKAYSNVPMKYINILKILHRNIKDIATPFHFRQLETRTDGSIESNASLSPEFIEESLDSGIDPLFVPPPLQNIPTLTTISDSTFELGQQFNEDILRELNRNVQPDLFDLIPQAEEEIQNIDKNLEEQLEEILDSMTEEQIISVFLSGQKERDKQFTEIEQDPSDLSLLLFSEEQEKEEEEKGRIYSPPITGVTRTRGEIESEEFIDPFLEQQQELYSKRRRLSPEEQEQELYITPYPSPSLSSITKKMKHVKLEDFW